MTALADFPSGQTRHRAYREPGRPGPGPAVVPDAVLAADRSGTVRDHAKTVRSWPLLVLAAPAAAEVWSGWVGIAQKTGFGMVPPAARHLVLASPGHGRHPAGRRRVLRGLRTARLARHRPRDQRPDPAVREAVSGLLIRARHGRAGGVPPHGPGPDRHSTLGHHHPCVLPPGPGPRHGDRPGPHAARGRRGSRPPTARRPRTSHSRATRVAPRRAVRGPARPESAGPSRRRAPPAGPNQDTAPA
jgi:hypothetical protein